MILAVMGIDSTISHLLYLHSMLCDLRDSDLIVAPLIVYVESCTDFSTPQICLQINAVTYTPGIGFR